MSQVHENSAGDFEKEHLVKSTSASRVHFPDSQVTPEHAGEIVVQFDETKTSGEVHLGFLQEGRKYEVSIYVPIVVGSKVHVVNHNAHVKTKDVTINSDEDGHDLTLEIDAIQDKLIDDELKVVNLTDESHFFMLILKAKILGKGQGTPLLKRGVKCVGYDESHGRGGDLDFEASGSDVESGRIHRKASSSSHGHTCNQSQGVSQGHGATVCGDDEDNSGNKLTDPKHHGPHHLHPQQQQHAHHQIGLSLHPDHHTHHHSAKHCCSGEQHDRHKRNEK